MLNRFDNCKIKKLYTTIHEYKHILQTEKIFTKHIKMVYAQNT